MRGYTNTIKHSLLRLATVFTTLLVGMSFALMTSAASAGEIKKVEVVKPAVVEKVMLPVDKVVKNQAVKVDSSSDFVRPFGFARPFGFFRPFGFGFNPFFDVDVDFNGFVD